MIIYYSLSTPQYILNAVVKCCVLDINIYLHKVELHLLLTSTKSLIYIEKIVGLEIDFRETRCLTLNGHVKSTSQRLHTRSR